MTVEGSTLVDLLLLLTDPVYQGSIVSKLTDPLLQTFWADFPTHDTERRELVASTVNKFTPFLLDERMRAIVGQTKSTINIREIMDEGKILVVNPVSYTHLTLPTNREV